MWRLGGLAIAGFLFGYYWSDIGFLMRTGKRATRTAWQVGLICWDYKWHFPFGGNVIDPKLLLQRELVHERAARRLLHLFQRNGGIYVKVGQHLAALEYILPSNYCQTLSILHNDAPPSSLAEVTRVIEDDLRQPLDEIFSFFDPIPIGTASLAQVHRAILRHPVTNDEGNGNNLKTHQQEVAVKVQHLRLQPAIETDLFVISTVVRLVKRLFPNFDFDWIAEEMRLNLPRELDFINEAHNAERLVKYIRQYHGNDGFLVDSSDPINIGSSKGQHHRPHSGLRIPQIFWKHTTKRVLVMEYLPGAKATDRAFLQANNINPRQVSTLITKIFSEMIFIHGFVHCDPHPGNLLIRPLLPPQASNSYPSWWRRLWSASNENLFELVLLDHGLYRELPESFRRNYAGLWQSLIASDESAMSHYVKLLGGSETYYRLFSCILTQRPWRTIATGGLLLRGKLGEDEAAEIRAKAPQYLVQVADLLAHLPRPLLLLLKTNDLLRHLERSLLADDPSYKVPHTFITMAHYCIEAVYSSTYNETSWEWWKKRLLCWYYHLKIDLWTNYLQYCQR